VEKSYDLKVSIIIPAKEINDYIRESISYILNLDYQNFEIIVLPDKESNETFQKTKIVSTGHIGPAEKRDKGVKLAEGEILAFLDDDAYPRSDWLSKALLNFQNENISIVCGPGVTPKSDGFIQKASGAVYTSFLGSGNVRFRYWPHKKRFVDDFPSVNMLIRKKDFEKVGGFNTSFWPGEDTKLCLDILKLGKKILYDPEVFVWHHRRANIKEHLKQVFNYSQHRGFFAKKYPKTSLKALYFFPSLFLLFLILMPFFIKYQSGLYVYVFVLSIYILLLIIAGITEGLRYKSILIGLLVIPLIFLTHITYGIGFLLGLLKPKLISKLR